MSKQNDKTIIKPVKTIYPQIYAYVLPQVPFREGWVKIGYTERKNVDERIKEQVKTIGLTYELLWAEIAKDNQGDYFKDYRFHHYLTKFKNIEREKGSEWFLYGEDLFKSQEHFRDFIEGRFTEVANEQTQYTLREEQAEAVEKTINYWQANKGSEFLWNAKPRFGKTLSTYELIRRLEYKKVLIVTNRPAVAQSWYDDFKEFIEWQTDYCFVSTADTLSGQGALTRDEFLAQMNHKDGRKGMITFLSLQDLKGSLYFGGRHDKLKWIKELEWDLLVIDESHEGVETLKTEVAFEQIKRTNTLYLSGTPFKALEIGKFSEEAMYEWSYADEQKAKLNYESQEGINPYAALPTLSLFTYQMSPMITEEINKGAHIDGKEVAYAFDLNEFFATDESGKFIHESDIKKWLDALTTHEKYPFSTPELREKLKHTFWLLDRVSSVKALEKLLSKHATFKEYKVIIAAGDGKKIDEEENEPGKQALEKVKKAIAAHDKTITLSVGKLTTGVTVPQWTGIIMLSNITSPTLYMQAAFRVQNPWTYTKDGQAYQKETAYIFDFAPQRTLMIYAQMANHLSSRTVAGQGNTLNRQENIRTLLNFFPVIAEDDNGKMIEVDPQYVMTVPRLIKATEVVRRGFMSNLLFQNITGIFASEAAREILSQLKPVEKEGTIVKKATPLQTQGVQLDDEGRALVSKEIVVNQTEAHFGVALREQFTHELGEVIETVDISDHTRDLPQQLTKKNKDLAEDKVKAILIEQNIKPKDAASMAKTIVHNVNEEVEHDVKKAITHAEIQQKEVELTFQGTVEEIEKTASSEEKEQLLRNLEQEKAEKIEEINTELRDNIQSTVKIDDTAKKLSTQALEKVEDRKKQTVEDDVRARLRGFSRTIPSFLMAYGHKETTLSNFDQHIDDHVFKEVTGITLDQFRALRDQYQFFDEGVFNSSVQEFLNKCYELKDYFESQEEDIFDYIPPQRNNQIFTPKPVVKMMIDALEQENPDIFSNPNITFADLYMKSGLYIAEIVKRLYKGLATEMPDREKRLKHIFEQQVYGFAPSSIIHAIAQRFVMGFDEELGTIKHHLVLLDTIPYAKKEEDFSKKLQELFRRENMKFDVIVGNPPYQEDAKGDGTKDTPVYHYFYDLAEEYANKYCLVSPARFLSNVGSTPKEWNKKMLNDEHLKVVFFEQDSSRVFNGTDIKAGIVFIYRDSGKIFDAIRTFISFKELNSIVNKVEKLTINTLDEIVSNRGQYRYSDKIYQEYSNDMKKISDRRIASNAFDKLPHLFTEEKPEDGQEYVQILGRFENVRLLKWFKKAYLSPPDNFDTFKVILPKANGSGAIGEVLSTPLIGEPLIGFTETFIGIGTFSTRAEAEHCMKYIRTKFARAMLGVLKVTQDNTRDTWSKVPLQDFTTNSDIDWSVSISDIDQQLYKKYGLDEHEIAFIEEKVRAMK